jgi:flavorubredoxin
LLVDTGRPNSWGEISRNLEAALGGRPLDYLFPTHPELPHSGNLGRLAEKYPEALIVGDTRDYHLFYPETEPRLVPKKPGDEIDLGGGYRFRVVEAVIHDLPNTQWGYEVSGQVLFTSDGFAFMHDGGHGDFDDAVHVPGECGLLTSEIDGPISVDYAAFYTGSAIYWTRFIDDADELFGRFEELLAEHPARVFAPGHGNVVDTLDEVLPVMKQAHVEAFANWSKRRVA